MKTDIAVINKGRGPQLSTSRISPAGPGKKAARSGRSPSCQARSNAEMAASIRDQLSNDSAGPASVLRTSSADERAAANRRLFQHGKKNLGRG
ncbi:MAG TPA: hypothetical protein VJ783_19110 [Pirellulales bacterium]|nr:hypothetical protein [Pirellulales bacterium]